MFQPMQCSKCGNIGQQYDATSSMCILGAIRHTIVYAQPRRANESVSRKATEEHFIITCGRCGYWWKESIPTEGPKK